MKAAHTSRVFKTARFIKNAKKAHIADAELCAAIAQVQAGQADDLVAFRMLARSYAGLTCEQLEALLATHDLQKICHAPLQE